MKTISFGFFERKKFTDSHFAGQSSSYFGALQQGNKSRCELIKTRLEHRSKFRFPSGCWQSYKPSDTSALFTYKILQTPFSIQNCLSGKIYDLVKQNKKKEQWNHKGISISLSFLKELRHQLISEWELGSRNLTDTQQKRKSQTACLNVSEKCLMTETICMLLSPNHVSLSQVFCQAVPFLRRYVLSRQISIFFSCIFLFYVDSIKIQFSFKKNQLTSKQLEAASINKKCKF